MEAFLYIVPLLILVPMVIAGISFAPWVPCRKRDLDRIFKLAKLKPGEVFYDLGCGDGRTVFYAADNCGAKAIGLEISWVQYCTCLIKKLFRKNSRATFKLKNLFHEDLSQADVVYFFGMPETIKNKLGQKLEKELKKGARVVSYTFHIPNWIPAITDKPTKDDATIFYYEVA